MGCWMDHNLFDFFTRWDEEIYKEWAAGVSEACSFNLSQPLVVRDEETKLISVNFDPQLTAVLREVKYLESSSQEDIPASAAEMYKSNDTLWKYLTNLDLSVHLYNKVRNTILEVEFPLIEGQLQDIDVQLEQAEKSLNWESQGVWEYIEKTRDQITDLEKRVQQAKDNVEEVKTLMATWSKQPLFERKEDKYDTLLNLDDRKERLNKRYEEIKNIGEKIHGLLQVGKHKLICDFL